jgi:ribose-phosphate pyrophosphokinase
MCEGARALRDNGAKKIWAYATHPVLSGPAPERLLGAPFEEIVVTNTIPLRPEAQRLKNLRQLSVAPLIGSAIQLVHKKDSLSTLFA